VTMQIQSPSKFEKTPAHLSGRFRLLKESELSSPAKCVFCGTIPSVTGPLATGKSSAEELKEVVITEHGDPDRGIPHETTLIDGNLVFEYYGNVYFCRNCTLELARMFGAVSTEEYDNLLMEFKQLYEQNVALKNYTAEVEEFNANLTRELSRHAPVSVRDGRVTIAETENTVAKETESGNDGGSVPPLTVYGSTERESAPSEFTEREGPDGIFDPSISI